MFVFQHVQSGGSEPQPEKKKTDRGTRTYTSLLLLVSLFFFFLYFLLIPHICLLKPVNKITLCIWNLSCSYPPCSKILHTSSFHNSSPTCRFSVLTSFQRERGSWSSQSEVFAGKSTAHEQRGGVFPQCNQFDRDGGLWSLSGIWKSVCAGFKRPHQPCINVVNAAKET